MAMGQSGPPPPAPLPPPLAQAQAQTPRRAEAPPGLIVRQMLCGSLARATAATLLIPLDTCKTRLQFQGLMSDAVVRRYHGLWDAFRTIVREEGPLALYRGTAVCLSLSLSLCVYIYVCARGGTGIRMGMRMGLLVYERVCVCVRVYVVLVADGRHGGRGVNQACRQGCCT
jgi:hypothetical protein